MQILREKIDSAYTYLKEDNISENDYDIIKIRLLYEHKEILNDFQTKKTFMAQSEKDILEAELNALNNSLVPFHRQNKEEALQTIITRENNKRQIAEKSATLIDDFSKLRKYFDKCFSILEKHQNNLDTKRAENLYKFAASLIVCEYENTKAYVDNLEAKLPELSDEELKDYVDKLTRLVNEIQEYEYKTNQYETLASSNPYAFYTEYEFKEELKECKSNNIIIKSFLILSLSGVLAVNIRSVLFSENLFPEAASLMLLLLLSTIGVTVVTAGVANAFMMLNDSYDELKIAYDDYLANKEEKQLKLKSIINSSK